MNRLIRFMLLLTFVLSVTTAIAAGDKMKQPAGIDLVKIKGGCFLQGAVNGNSAEKPLHEVCVADYYIGRYEVTQQEWQQLMGYNPSRFVNCGADCPVDQVSWSDAREFISRLNEKTGRNYRLPTEAEWEFACRERGKDITYCGSKPINAIAWHSGNSDNRPHPAGEKQPNSLGLYDMSGNVWEWVHDWNGAYPAGQQNNPSGAVSGSTRVRRGGSWQYDAAKSGSTWRSSGYPDDRALDIGFRLAHPAAE